MRKLSIVLILSIIALCLFAVGFIVGEQLYLYRVYTTVASKNNLGSRVPQAMNLKAAPLNVNNDVPNLKGGSENLPIISEKMNSTPQVFYNSKNRTLKQVALTFDDGPDAYYTLQILDILKAYNIKATFFIVGARAEAHPEVVKRIAYEGHSIGNHTWDHPLLTKIQHYKLKEEVDKAQQEIYSITGIKTAMFRPPYGSLTPEQVKEISSMGYSIIDWSVDTRDWAGTPVSQILKYVNKEVYPGGIILQHCAGGKDEDLSNTVKALPKIISLLRNEGYSFVTVQQLLGVPN